MGISPGHSEGPVPCHLTRADPSTQDSHDHLLSGISSRFLYSLMMFGDIRDAFFIICLKKLLSLEKSIKSLITKIFSLFSFLVFLNFKKISCLVNGH